MFVSMNASVGNLSMFISPYTSTVWHDGILNRTVYVSVCEEGTHGFVISTPAPTQKWYFFSTPTGYNPYVSYARNVIFDENYRVRSSGLIPKMCELNASADRIYSAITFQVTDGSGEYKERSVYGLTFRVAFNLNVSYYGSDKIELNLSRNGTCQYRDRATDEWLDINDVERMQIILNLSTNSNYDLRCNNTFNETTTGRYIGGGRILIDFFGTLIGGLFNETWRHIFGHSFKWEGWMIMVVIVLLLFILPTLLLVVLYVRNRSGSGEEGVAGGD
jgi:hypothetical protein